MGSKGGGQVVGYNYFAGLQVAIGNCIEQILNINPDNRGWIFTTKEEMEQLKNGDTSMVVLKGTIFGGEKGEGGWSGIIDIHTGRPEYLRQNDYLAAQDSELVSSFPFLSHLVFRGFQPNTSAPALDHGFFLCAMSGMLKDVLYWPKRIHIKDNGSPQWYDVKSEVPDQSGIQTASGLYTNLTIKRSQVGNPNSYINVGFSESVDWTARPEIGYYNFECTLVVEFDYETATDAEIHFDTMRSTGSSMSVASSFEVSGTCMTDIYWTRQCSYVFQIPKGKGHFRAEFKSQFSQNANPPEEDPAEFYFEISRPTLTSGEYYFDSGDINPLHKIREIITDDTAMNKPEAMINDANFKAAADRIWDEGLGVSGAFTEKSCKEAIDELLYHIEAGIRVNRQTGLYEIVLFRDDLLDLDNAQLFDKSNIKTFSIETANIDDVINSVNVNYYDRDNIKDSSFSLDEIGSVLSNQSNAETLDFPYFMNRRNAELVGNWKLKQLSTPTRKGTFTTGKYDARKINRYDVVKLTWHNQNMIEVPIRIMKIGLGDGRDNTVTLDWVEVIPYSSIVFPTINVDPPTSVVLPPQPNQSVAFEMPYFEAVQRFGQTQVDTELANNPDMGYLMVATKKPQNNSINALLFTDNGTGYQQTSIVDYCPVVQLDQDISYLDTSFAVKNVSSISQAEIGTLILCEEELMVYQNYDDVTKILTVKRAALDTVPKPHLQDAVFYFYDAFSAFDSEQYVLSEVIDAKVLTSTPSGVQELSEATAHSLTFSARAIRPYAPGNFKINNQYFPHFIIGPISLSWASRNRLQQTGGEPLGFQDGSVTPEEGTTYSVYAYNNTTGELKYSATDITTLTHVIGVSALLGISTVRLEVFSVRDGYSSYQAQRHVMEWSSGENLMTFDGAYAPDNGNAVVLQFIE